MIKSAMAWACRWLWKNRIVLTASWRRIGDIFISISSRIRGDWVILSWSNSIFILHHDWIEKIEQSMWFRSVMVQFLREQMKKNSKEEWKNREITWDGSSNSTWRIWVKWGVDEVMETRSDVASLGDWWTEDDSLSMNEIPLYLNHKWTSSISSFFVWETLLVARDQIHKDISSITMRESMDRLTKNWSEAMATWGLSKIIILTLSIHLPRRDRFNAINRYRNMTIITFIQTDYLCYSDRHRPSQEQSYFRCSVNFRSDLRQRRSADVQNQAWTLWLEKSL